MKTVDYKVLLEPAPEGGYVVYCPSLPGCYSQGDTVEESLSNIKEAIQLCLEDMREAGEELPDPSESLIGSVVVEQ
jgi:predicted RNase H-like HicB family nuclease